MKKLFLELLENQELQLLNPKQSQKSGRLIFKPARYVLGVENLGQGDHLHNSQEYDFIRQAHSISHHAVNDGDLFAIPQKLWIKLQFRQHPLYERYFLHELQQYQRLSRAGVKVLLPYEVVQYSQFNHELQHKIQNIQESVSKQHAELFLPEALVTVNSTSLFDLDPNQMSWESIIHRLTCSAEVLSNLHQCNYVHGDLKPEHFRIYQKKTYLIDFEQGGFLDERINMENSATPRYMAPELFHAEQKSIESDIYALGIIWFEWLMQQKIKHKSYLDWAKWHCQQFDVQLLSAYDALADILNSMLAKKKVNRCTNIYEIKQRLSDFV